jgi:hypothetical protein
MFWPWIKSSAVPLAAQTAFIAPDGFIAGLLSHAEAEQGAAQQAAPGRDRAAVRRLRRPGGHAQRRAGERDHRHARARHQGARRADALIDSAWAFWEIRAEYDAVETTLWDGYAWVVGEPNIPGVLWPQVEAQGDTILSAAVDDGTIVGYRPTKVVNTADDTAAGKLIIEHQVQFTVDARYVTIRIDRVVDASAS